MNLYRLKVPKAIVLLFVILIVLLISQLRRYNQDNEIIISGDDFGIGGIGAREDDNDDDLLLAGRDSVGLRQPTVNSSKILMDNEYVFQFSNDEQVKKWSSSDQLNVGCIKKTPHEHCYVCPYGNNNNNEKDANAIAHLVVQRLIRFMRYTRQCGFVDVGAGYGAVSIPLAASLTALGSVASNRAFILVEPNPDGARSLARSIFLNKYNRSDFAILKRALTFTNRNDISNVGRYRITSKSSSRGALFSDPLNLEIARNIFDGEEFDVPIGSLDSHVRPVALAMGLRTVILRINGEGTECAIIQGGKLFFSTFYVPFIVMEWTWRKSRSVHLDCLHTMLFRFEQLWYVPFKIDSVGLEKQLNQKKYWQWDVDVVLWKKIV